MGLPEISSVTWQLRCMSFVWLIFHTVCVVWYRISCVSSVQSSAFGRLFAGIYCLLSWLSMIRYWLCYRYINWCAVPYNLTLVLQYDKRNNTGKWEWRQETVKNCLLVVLNWFNPFWPGDACMHSWSGSLIFQVNASHLHKQCYL